MLYVLARGISGGRRAAVVSVLGVHAATLCFVVAAALGLSTLLASSSVAFAALRYAGAGYLVLLGIRALGDRSGVDTPAPPVPDRRTFRQAYAVGISNPKVAVFLLAFLPQFVSPAAGSATGQVLILGLVFLAVALVADLGWALLAGALAGWLRRHPAVLRRQRFATGPLQIGLGAYAAISGTSSR